MSDTEQHKDKDKKKSLITEKITGRRLTPARVIRNMVLALFLGALFGLAASAVFIAVMNLRESGIGSDYVNINAETSATEPETEPLPEETNAPETEPEGESEKESEAETEPESEPETESEAEPESETEPESDTEPHEEETVGEDVSFSRAALIARVEKSLVRISATTTGTTWFESEVSSTETLSGIILEVGEDEILILAPDAVRDKDSLRAEFAGGITADVYVKSFSAADGLCVLAADGMDEGLSEGLASLSPAEEESITPGTELMAVGSPLGVAGSYSFGDIAYIAVNEPGFDTSETVFYADISGDAASGTFIVDLDGELVGVASETGESAVGADALRIVSAESLKDTVDRLKDGGSIPYIGLKASAVSFDMRYSGIPEGCYVIDVDSLSPAYTAGLKRGDIVISVDDKSVTDMAGYCESLRKVTPGESMTLTVMRLSGSDYRELEFTLETDTR